MHRLGDVLDGLFALIEELQFELVADLIAHHRRAGDAARPRQPLEPRRHVDAVAIEIVALDDDVAEIDADAELDVPVLGNSGVALRHAALDFDRAARRVKNAAELDQEAVAHHLEDAPAMLGHGGIEELAAMLAKRAQRALLVGLHEPAVANDVGRQDGGKSTFNAFRGHPKVRCSPRRVDDVCQHHNSRIANRLDTTPQHYSGESFRSETDLTRLMPV